MIKLLVILFIIKLFAQNILTLKMGIILSKVDIYELQLYKGVLCHDNEEWYKTWRGINLSVQNWHEEFDNFWSEHSKIPKVCTLIGWFKWKV